MEPKVVLVADDDPGVRRLFRRILSDEFTILEAADGEEAVAMAIDKRPSVVLLDLQMPRLDGLGAVVRMREHRELSATPILIVTGASTSGEQAANCLRLGAHDFVRKPFETCELQARVWAAYRHKALEDELRLRNQELEVFASSAAHDLREPLFAIALMVDLLEGVELDPPTRAKLERVGQLAGQASRLVTDLLALARDDWVSAALVHPVDVEGVVLAVVEDANLPDATVTIGGTWEKLVVPDIVLTSWIANLVANANHYGRDDTGHLELVITGTAGDDHLEIVVEDSGPGIDPAVGPRIFEPFATAPDSAVRNPSSSGLGLAIVARTVARYGGRLELVSGRAVGCAFRITVPLTGD